MELSWNPMDGIFTYKGIDVSNVTNIDEIQNYGETQQEFIEFIY